MTSGGARDTGFAELDEPFADGDERYVIGTMPSSLPVFGTQEGSGSSGFADFLMTVVYFVLGAVVARRVDPTWKVVVSRRRKGFGHQWRVVDLSFVPSADAAEELGERIGTDWRPGQFADAAPIRWRDYGRIREDCLSSLDRAASRQLKRKRARGLTTFSVVAFVLTGLCAAVGNASGVLTAIPIGLVAVTASIKSAASWRSASR